MGPQVEAAGRGKSNQCENRSHSACHNAGILKSLFPESFFGQQKRQNSYLTHASRQ